MGDWLGSTSNINIRAFQAVDVTGGRPGGVNKQDEGQCWKGGVSLRIAKSFSFFLSLLQMVDFKSLRPQALHNRSSSSWSPAKLLQPGPMHGHCSLCRHMAYSIWTHVRPLLALLARGILHMDPCATTVGVPSTSYTPLFPNNPVDSARLVAQLFHKHKGLMTQDCSSV